jgi:uncharacterized protein YggE
MKKATQFLLLTLLVSASVQAQSTERFIRIIGNAKKEISANKAKVQFSISEQKGNKYGQNSADISYQDTYDAAIAAFSKIGIDESELELVIQRERYSSVKSKNYYIITDFDKLEQISSIQVEGLKITEVTYLFDTSDENLETELSLNAINDAKRKAKAICDEIGMKVGKILNIEVKESVFGADKAENKKAEIVQSYRVAITFKLVD